MKEKNRDITAISLSFLDIMSCGFGAFILLFLIIKHYTDTTYLLPENYLELESKKIEEQIINVKTEFTRITAASAEASSQLEVLIKKTNDIDSQLSSLESQIKQKKISKTNIQALKTDLNLLRNKKTELKKKTKGGKNIREFIGDGNREYLTGMKVGGEHVLILLDKSASMIDKSIVNVIRKRNMKSDVKKRSQKWVQAISTVDWLSTRFEPGTKYQIYVFDSKTNSILPEKTNEWLFSDDTLTLNNAISRLSSIEPSGGSNLESAFRMASKLKPKPDNIYLITDGLPTLGQKEVNRAIITGNDRLKLFESAVTQIPIATPVNTILLPMEGDPLAPWAYWGVAAVTSGSFVTPASDWP